MASSQPDYHWQAVGTDFFELDKKYYLVVVDYFSCYPEVVKMSYTASACTIAVLKIFFAWYGISEIVRSDSLSIAIKNCSFCGNLSFSASPLFPLSNRQTERTVQTLKKMVTKSNDVSRSLLNYHSTPLSWCNLLPS